MSLQTQSIEHDVAVYLAGLYDGEGCFTISKQKKSQGYCYSPSMQIVLTHEETIKWISDKLDRKYRHVKARSGMNWKDTYALYIGDASTIIAVIEQIVPFMITKKPAADALLEFCKSRKDNWPANNYERGYNTMEMGLYNLIKGFNKRGITL